MKNLLIAALGAVALTATAVDAQSTGRTIPMLVTAEWLAERLDEPDLVIVQVDQRRDGYDAGHIPGARYLQYSLIAGTVDGTPVELLPIESLQSALADVEVLDGRRVVLYGAPLSAARAWMTLDYLGVSERVAMLDGGIEAWRAAGHPVSTEVTPITVQPGANSTLAVNPQPQRIISAETVLARRDDPRIALIDARPIAEYTGDDGGQNGRYLAGHIPGARHLHWEELIESTDDPRLLSVDDLRQLFEAAGAGEGKEVFVYCTVGMRASMAYFVSRMLGYETFLYDGSWADWSAREMPIEAGPDPLGSVTGAHP
jgi:thiosulfate/3-mercaptopyruvate sulfurtransferase